MAAATDVDRRRRRPARNGSRHSALLARHAPLRRLCPPRRGRRMRAGRIGRSRRRRAAVQPASPQPHPRHDSRRGLSPSAPRHLPSCGFVSPRHRSGGCACTWLSSRRSRRRRGPKTPPPCVPRRARRVDICPRHSRPQPLQPARSMGTAIPITSHKDSGRTLTAWSTAIALEARPAGPSPSQPRPARRWTTMSGGGSVAGQTAMTSPIRD